MKWLKCLLERPGIAAIIKALQSSRYIMILKNEIPHSQLEDQPKKTFISLTHISSMSHFHTP